MCEAMCRACGALSLAEVEQWAGRGVKCRGLVRQVDAELRRMEGSATKGIEVKSRAKQYEKLDFLGEGQVSTHSSASGI